MRVGKQMSDGDNPTTTSEWYLVQVKPNSLGRAQSNLSRQGFEFFVPRERRSVRRSGKFVTAEEPVFAGYLFVKLDPEDSSWRAINSTYGVARLVSFGSQPTALPKGLVDELRTKYAEGGTGAPDLSVGDNVVIREGPFADFLASVDAMDPEQSVHLLIAYMGRHHRISVEAEKLRKA